MNALDETLDRTVTALCEAIGSGAHRLGAGCRSCGLLRPVLVSYGRLCAEQALARQKSPLDVITAWSAGWSVGRAENTPKTPLNGDETMARWAHVTNPAIDADWLVEKLALDPHDEPRCPQCGGRLRVWPGEPYRSEPEDGGVILYWQQTHSCGARLRALADLGDEL